MNAVIRRALEPNVRKILCAIEEVEKAGGGVATTNVTPTLASSSGSGSTTAGIYRVSVTNTGGVGGTFAGTTITSGTTVTFEGYVDPISGEFKRLASIPYDATGTTFLITETP